MKNNNKTVYYIIFFLIGLVIISIDSLTCYNGYRLLSGRSIGEETEDCEGSMAYCYNFTAETGAMLNVMKAGCSTYRCLLSRNKCISTEFQNVPVKFCCCNEDRCNGDDNR
uniref:Activin_recp domain-containing protein n=1 Tax=Parastrongyloides trichosuri TaxID=131310 RepID=A0A0N4ZNM6_PARTI